MSERNTLLLEQMLAEQKQQTRLLEQIATQSLALIEALADDVVSDPDELPLTHYLDGRPCR